MEFESIDSLNAIGSFRKAEKKIDTLQTCSELKAQKEMYFQSLVWKYQLLRNRRKYKKAFLYAEQALQYHQQNFPSDFQNLELQLNFLEASALTGKKEHALKYLDETKKILTSLNPLNKHSLAYFNFIEGFYAQHISWDKDAALVAYQQAINLYLEMDNPPAYHLGQSLRYIGILKRIDADYENSLAYFEQELFLYQKHYPENHIEIANTNFNIGNIHYFLLNYQKALNHYLACFEVWKKRYKPGAKYLRMLLEAIGDMYWELDNREKAFEFYELAEFKEKKTNLDKSIPIAKAGDSLLQIGKYDGALNYYREALAFREREFGKKHAMTGACQNFIARAYRFAGKTEEALLAYQKSIAILTNTMQDSSFYTNPTLDQHISAEEQLLEAMAAKSILLKDRFDELGNQKDLDLAFQTQQLTLELMERIRQGPLSYASKLFWTQRAFPVLESSIETAINLHQITGDVSYLETAFNISEKAKAILLLSTLQESNATSYAGIPDSILTKERTLKDAIIENEGKIALEEQRCSERRTKRLTLRKERLLKHKNQYEAFLHQLKKDFPKYYALKFKMETASISQLRQNLLKDEQTALLAFFEGEKHVYIFLLDKNELKAFSIKRGEDYEKNMHSFYESLTGTKLLLQNPQEAYEKFIQASTTLFHKLVETSLKACSKNINRLLIIPDGQLSYLPFECLLTTSVDPAKRAYQKLPYLFRKYAISYSQSASLLLQTLDAKKHRKASKNYLGFAPEYSNKKHPRKDRSVGNLIFHENEVRQTSKFFGGQFYLKEAASEENFKAKSKDAAILHLAMHALRNDQEPLLSSLLFTPSDTIKEDGLLHAYELYKIPLHADLVILSACETATGTWERGEGMMSLERAFQYAGCPALLSTLWVIDDASTSDLILGFLKNIKEGIPKDIALQKAKLAFLDNADPASLHPFFWAGFRLNGNSEVIETSYAIPWKIPLALLFLLVLFVGVLKWNNSL